MKVRILKPAKTAMQSGQANTREWLLESEPAPNTRRIVVVDLTTGQSADLLNGFEAASIKPMEPSITPDGKAVLIATGNGTGPLLIDLSNFPSGPYPRTDVGRGSFALGPVAAGSAPGSPFAFTDSSGLEVGTIGGSSFKQVQAPNTFLDLHPTFGSPGGTPTLVFDSLDTALNAGPILFCSPFSPTGPCQPQQLPGIVNTSAPETRPAFTPDGRYIGFLRTVAGHQRLFVWDTTGDVQVEPGQ